MNSLNIIGRVGKDAETKTVGNGRLATAWSVAVNVGWGEKQETLWFDCTMWGERGEKVGAHILKGDQVGVSGSMSTREHDGKTYMKIDVQDVTLLGGKRDDKGNDRPQQQRPAPTRSQNTGSRPAPMQAPADDFSDDNIGF